MDGKKVELLAGYTEQLGTPETLEQAIAERNAWVESAAQFSRNEDYYRGLLDEIAAAVGPEAWKADNGEVVDDEPVRARLPDLVRAMACTPKPEAPVEGEVDLLAELAKRSNWELSCGPVAGDLSTCAWLIHSVNGGLNDREWTLIGQGETPAEALRAALQQEKK